MRIKMTRYLLTGLIAGFFLPGLVAAEEKTMKRVDDPIVVQGKDFIALYGSPPDRLSLMARNGQEWAPVPFQIDQRKPDGKYCFTYGPEASEDPDINLDSNDELVFMVKDTGERVEDDKWPEGSEQVMELEITDPKNGNRGWLYLVRFSCRAPRSEDDYIRVELDPEKKYRKVVTYEYVMGGPMNVVYPNHMSARELENGEPGLDILDRLKMRGEVVLPLGIRIPFVMDEMVKSEDRGYIDGPVRVLHLSRGYLEITDYIKIRGQGYSLISYYVNHMIWPMVMEMPNISLITIENFHGYCDFNSDVLGSCAFSAANPYNEDVIFDGQLTEAEKNLDTETHIDWIAGFGPQGAIFNRTFFEPREAVLKQGHYFVDDPTMADEPEDHPGVFGTGYHMIFPEDPPPLATVYQYYYFLSKLKPEEASRILDILDHPVEVSVKTVPSLDRSPLE